MYKNPRLKHVKEIKEICNEMSSSYGTYYPSKLLYQCNLLLETKKKKKCDGTDWVDVICDSCNKVWRVNHIKNNCTVKLKNSPINTVRCKWCNRPPEEHYQGDHLYIAPDPKEELKPSPQPEIEPLSLDSTNQLFMLTEMKINEVIDQLNKLTKTK